MIAPNGLFNAAICNKKHILLYFSGQIYINLQINLEKMPKK